MSNRQAKSLLDRPLDGVLAIRGREAVTVRQFLADVDALASQLPDGTHVLNLARDRYLFTVAFAAAMTRGQCNLLPPSPTPGAQRAIAAEHGGDPCVLHDGAAACPELAALDLRDAVRSSGESSAVPAVDPDALVSISYTSGSTGTASPVKRYWRTHFDGAKINAEAYLDDVPGPLAMVATVPPQHMYGLEVTVMIPLCREVAVSSGKPLYPADVARALSAVPAPRVLVSTPLHLKALLESGIDFPPITRILSATAPLDAPLAARVEQRLGAELIDIYGCSETGCLAVRRPAVDERWRPFPAFRFSERDGTTMVGADHLPGDTLLQDRLHVGADGRLEILGRAADLVNVGGKRSSLAELTFLLNRVPGVDDGTVFRPESADPAGRVAGVYAGSATPGSVRRFLREHLDPVLVPRPLVQVDALPRNDTGKLPRAALQELLDHHADG